VLRRVEFPMAAGGLRPLPTRRWPPRTSLTLRQSGSRRRQVRASRRRTGGEHPATRQQQPTRNDSKRQGQRRYRSIAPGHEMAMLAFTQLGPQVAILMAVRVALRPPGRPAAHSPAGGHRGDLIRSASVTNVRIPTDAIERDPADGWGRRASGASRPDRGMSRDIHLCYVHD
jgi:hypothetical protein